MLLWSLASLQCTWRAKGLLQCRPTWVLKRCKQCEELLALASWLLYSDPKHAVPVMKAQLNRLYGQLHALMGRLAHMLLFLLVHIVGLQLLYCFAACRSFD